MTKPTSQPSPRIPIDTCEGLFEKLKWDHQQLQEDWNEYRTFNFVVTAYHLYADWINHVGSKAQRSRKGKLPAIGKKLFYTLRDITNASKHWLLDTKSQKRQIVQGVSKAQIGDWHAYFITGPVLYVSIGKACPSIPELAIITIECFEWILNGETDTFPETLNERIGIIFKPLY